MKNLLRFLAIISLVIILPISALANPLQSICNPTTEHLDDTTGGCVPNSSDSSDIPNSDSSPQNTSSGSNSIPDTGSQNGYSVDSQDACTNQGGQWDGTKCVNSQDGYSVDSQDACTNQGGQWDGTNCVSNNSSSSQNDFVAPPQSDFIAPPPCPAGAGKICDPLGERYDSVPKFIKTILEGVIKIGMPVIALAIVYCGFLFVFARGKPEELTKARNALLYTMIGAAILLGSWTVAKMIQATVLAF